MKHNLPLLLLVAVLFSSCSQVYHYVQVFEAKSSQSSQTKKESGGMLYEDNNCTLYYIFWAKGGDASFAIHNKTDKIMYVDLSKSFFIRNGIANDYYKERAWSQTSTNTFGTQETTSTSVTNNTSYSSGIKATYLGDFGTLPFSTADPVSTSANIQRTESDGILRSVATANSFATSTSSSIGMKEQRIIAIPPHASKIVTEYAINTTLLLDCDLSRYPEEKASITFDEQNSPLKFSNYITYRLEDNTQDIVVKNDFYISKVTNYAQPAIYTFVERAKKPCQNVTSDDSKDYKDKYPVKVYDKVFNIDRSNCFYLEYKIQTNRQLYKKGGGSYYYDGYYNGYTKGEYDEQSAYKQRLLNPFVKP